MGTDRLAKRKIMHVTWLLARKKTNQQVEGRPCALGTARCDGEQEIGYCDVTGPDLRPVKVLQRKL